MLTRFLWLALFVFSNVVVAFQSNLSEAQCARFYKEYQAIAVKMNSSTGDNLQSLANRYGRLQERLDVFCSHTQFVTSDSQVKTNANESKQTEKSILYSDEEKQLAWEQFYTAPSYCLSKPVNSVNKVRCKNELDRFQELFEQQWKQNNVLTEKPNRVEQTNINDEASVQKESIEVKQDIDKDTKEANKNQNVTSSAEVKAKPLVNNNLDLQQKTTGLDTLFVYFEDYIIILVLLLILLVVIRFVLPVAKKLFTKHFSYIAVNKYLMKHLPVSDYTLYSKISLPIPSGMADIDELVLSPYGIFVISCQPQTGRIYADTTSEVWTEQVGKNRNNFPNPSKQLPLKIAGVKQLFGIDEHIHGLIVFDQEADFRTNMPSNVFQTGQLLAKIEHYDESVFTQEQISHFVLLLSEYKTSNPFKEIISNFGQKNTPKSEWES
jgi:hypothetical protein